MSVPADRNRDDGFAIEPRNRLFEAHCSAVEREARAAGSTTLLGEVDLRDVERLRSQVLAIRPPSYTALVVKAVAMALREVPRANRRAYREGFWPFARTRLQTFARRDVAVALGREIPGAEGATLVGVLRDADLAPLDEITVALKALEKADPSTNPHFREISGPAGFKEVPDSPDRWVRTRGGAALVVPPAGEGVDAVLGTWSHPIAVSFGSARRRPAAVGNAVEVRPTCFLGLTYDRRVLSPTTAGRLFHRVVAILEKAEAEMKPYLPEEVPVTREDFPTLDEPLTRL